MQILCLKLVPMFVSQVRLRCKEKLFDQDSCKKYKTKSKKVSVPRRRTCSHSLFVWTASRSFCPEEFLAVSECVLKINFAYDENP